MSAFSLLVLSLAILVDCAHGHGAFSRCRLLYPRDTCYLVYRSLREALLANKTNIFEMQQAFYPMGRLTSRKQVNILYTIDLTDDAMMIPLCAGATDDKNTTSPISILAAWSNSEIFNVISPYQISELQLQIANIFYGFFVIPGSGMPASDMFGWTLKDAENNRVSLQEVNLMYINMLLNDDISCLPDERILMSVLQDITIMIKMWASTEGQIPGGIDEDQLGFPVEPGFRIHGVSQLIFTPFFALMLSVVSFLLGTCSIIVLGVTMPKVYGYFSQERRQFKYYLFALSACLFVLNLVIICIELLDIPNKCETIHYSYVTFGLEKGCGEVIIVKLTFFVLSILLSFVSAFLLARNTKLLQFQTRVPNICKQFISFCCFWSIILFVSLVVWAIVPTIFMTIVYPNIILTMTVIMLAFIFWFSVIITIPQIFIHNIRMNMRCLDSLVYVAPFGILVMILFVIGILTLTYINCVIFGSDIGGPIGLLLATIPSIFLTFFSEFYRDWFLTRTTGGADNNDNQGGLSKTAASAISTTQTSVGIVITNKESTESEEPANNANTTEAINNSRPDTSLQLSSLPEADKKVINRRRNVTRLVSTGEPPGLLQRQLRGFSFGQHHHLKDQTNINCQ